MDSKQSKWRANKELDSTQKFGQQMAAHESQQMQQQMGSKNNMKVIWN